MRLEETTDGTASTVDADDDKANPSVNITGVDDDDGCSL